MAELADALDSDSSKGNFVQVQILLSAPKTKNKKRFSIKPMEDFVYAIKINGVQNFAHQFF